MQAQSGFGSTGADYVPSGAGAGEGYGSSGNSHSGGVRDNIDKTGNLDQHAHKYESTGAGGPTSSGAANTDKFDTGSSGASAPPTVEQDDSHRKGTGGIGGIVSLSPSSSSSEEDDGS